MKIHQASLEKLRLALNANRQFTPGERAMATEMLDRLRRDALAERGMGAPLKTYPPAKTYVDDPDNPPGEAEIERRQRERDEWDHARRLYRAGLAETLDHLDMIDLDDGTKQVLAGLIEVARYDFGSLPSHRRSRSTASVQAEIARAERAKERAAKSLAAERDDRERDTLARLSVLMAASEDDAARLAALERRCDALENAVRSTDKTTKET